MALFIVILLVLIVIGFIRGLERSLAVSGDPDVVLIYAVSSQENIESSSISASTPDFVAASVQGAWQRYNVVHVSPELYLGTRVTAGNQSNGLGLVRGITVAAPLVRKDVRIVDGVWPGAGEVMIGRLVASKLGVTESSLAIGQSIEFEGRRWLVSGRFAAQGSAFESEIWCNLEDFQTSTKRQDISLVALRMFPNSIGQIQLFCKQRTDLELTAIAETAYYAAIQKHYAPVRMLAWLVVALVASSGVFAGMNMMFGAVAGRVREFATLQAIGYRRRSILLGLTQEGLLLAAGASVLASATSLWLINGLAIRFTMGAFALVIDAYAILIACAVGVFIGCFGTIPPAAKALRADVANSLKAI